MALSYLACWQDEICFSEVNLGVGWGLLVSPILLSLSLSGRSPKMTEILLPWALSLNLIIQNLSVVMHKLFPLGSINPM